ncbi:MAG TPA: hypothetical protein VK742_08340 [Candidatus Sulfotelmatobacter sp.]|jgi:hypothetical protein|nr:hypothetical protein [Candidatus Sulfotelmatobacter sp.]
MSAPSTLVGPWKIVSQKGGTVVTAGMGTYANRAAYNAAIALGTNVNGGGSYGNGNANTSYNGTIAEAQQTAQLEQSLSGAETEGEDTAETAAGANYAASVSTLAGADVAANETSDAITATQNYDPNPTLDGTAIPAATSGTPWATYLIYGGLAGLVYWLWKKYGKKI